MKLRSLLPGLPALALLLASAAPAQQTDVAEVEIERGPTDLVAVLRPQPIDPDVVDTALVFTNRGHRPAQVKCVALNHNGVPVGRARVRVPGRGLRFALASDMARDRDFAGSVQCTARGRVIGSALLLAPGGVTGLPAKQGDHGGAIRIGFPVVAAL